MSAVEHYLMSVHIGNGLVAHAYVMADNPGQRDFSRNRLIDEIEKMGARPPLGVIILETRLNKPLIKKVHAFIRKLHPEADDTRKQATTSHLTIFVSPATGPEVDWLMELH